MELRDFIVTPIVLFIIYLIAYFVRPYLTDDITKRYFFPALTVRVIGAIALGMVYQFYYGGGDTFTFHTHGSRHIWEALIDYPMVGLKMLFTSYGEFSPDAYQYTSKIWLYRDLSSGMVIKVAAVIDLFTYSTYSATAVIFSVISFIGAWAFFQVFYRRFPQCHLAIAIASLFVPSVVFWGSGILKDTLTLAALGLGTYSFDKIFILNKKTLFNVFLLIISFYIIFLIKKYILICFIPALILWVYLAKLRAIRSIVLRLLVAPIFLLGSIVIAYWSVLEVGKNDQKYALENIAQTAQVTAYDIAFWTGREAGSTYSLGELDGTFTSMIQLLPQAVNVSLFRPYLWEVKNPLMLLSALESLCVLWLTVLVVWRTRIVGIFANEERSILLFCFVFALIFAFAVGVSTFNFGTLMRYKIPLMPYFISALSILFYHSKRERKLA